MQNLDGEQAVANLQSVAESGVTGEIMFIQDFPPSGPTIILGNVTGLTKGKHGLHIHQSGDTRDDCTKIGDHFNPYLVSNILFLVNIFCYDLDRSENYQTCLAQEKITYVEYNSFSKNLNI